MLLCCFDLNANKSRKKEARLLLAGWLVVTQRNKVISIRFWMKVVYR